MSHHLHEDLIANPQTAVIYARADGVISFWNAGAEKLFGHSIEEVAGKRLDIIVPEEYRVMHWAGFNRTIGSEWRGSGEWGPIEGLHRNGSRVALEVFLTPLHREGPGVSGVMALFRVPLP